MHVLWIHAFCLKDMCGFEFILTLWFLFQSDFFSVLPPSPFHILHFCFCSFSLITPDMSDMLPSILFPVSGFHREWRWISLDSTNSAAGPWAWPAHYAEESGQHSLAHVRSGLPGAFCGGAETSPVRIPWHLQLAASTAAHRQVDGASWPQVCGAVACPQQWNS